MWPKREVVDRRPEGERDEARQARQQQDAADLPQQVQRQQAAQHDGAGDERDPRHRA